MTSSVSAVCTGTGWSPRCELLIAYEAHVRAISTCRELTVYELRAQGFGGLKFPLYSLHWHRRVSWSGVYEVGATGLAVDSWLLAVLLSGWFGA